MPYPSTHKPQSREKILHSAAKLFSHQGFDNVSIDNVMADAGLTRGAFYSHFPDKSTLYAEAITYAAKNRFAKYTRELDPQGRLAVLLSSYLSREHFEQDTNPCPLAFLATDVSHRDPLVRNTYTRVYQGMVKWLDKLSSNSPMREQCLAATALMIGGVAIARALDDSATVDELLAACLQQSLVLLEGGADANG